MLEGLEFRNFPNFWFCQTPDPRRRDQEGISKRHCTVGTLLDKIGGFYLKLFSTLVEKSTKNPKNRSMEAGQNLTFSLRSREIPIFTPDGVFGDFWRFLGFLGLIFYSMLWKITHSSKNPKSPKTPKTGKIADVFQKRAHWSKRYWKML